MEVENDLAAFLPDDSASRQGLDVMEEQFTTYGTAQVMVANLTLENAQAFQEQLAALDGVQTVRSTIPPAITPGPRRCTGWRSAMMKRMTDTWMCWRR